MYFIYLKLNIVCLITVFVIIYFDSRKNRFDYTQI